MPFKQTSQVWCQVSQEGCIHLGLDKNISAALHTKSIGWAAFSFRCQEQAKILSVLPLPLLLYIHTNRLCICSVYMFIYLNSPCELFLISVHSRKTPFYFNT